MGGAKAVKCVFEVRPRVRRGGVMSIFLPERSCRPCTSETGVAGIDSMIPGIEFKSFRVDDSKILQM